ncbi:YczE/YyaS/YitT family protein [Tindallia californiensis]|uniref:Uncharacterized membrane protein YczE n=1 Tax=Tindallia californiensis TaxID=159292 RepID=A0A1H3N8Y6_9FIRM|nr:DUF6198 family protein [Tindallia californiensis]SDY85397.1 Uncharacterized membrane protein YczE [Tindallia californiensis]
MIKRVIIYIVGMFLLAMGVAFSIKSGLGVSPVSSFPYAMSIVLDKDVGLMSALVFMFYVMVQIALLRKEFHPKNLLQVGVASMFGIFVSFSNALLITVYPDTYLSRIYLLLISLVLIAIGIIFYLTANLVPQPPEGMVLSIQKKTGIPFSKVKIIFDCSSVLVAAFLLLVATGQVQGLREGTLIAALGVGKLIGILSKWLRPVLISFIEKAY